MKKETRLRLRGINTEIERLSLSRNNVLDRSEYIDEIKQKQRYKYLMKKHPDFIKKIDCIIMELANISTTVERQTEIDTLKNKAYRLISL